MVVLDALLGIKQGSEEVSRMLQDCDSFFDEQRTFKSQAESRLFPVVEADINTAEHVE